MPARRLLAIAFAASCATLAAHAASFDCAKAQSKVEKKICGDAALGALDEQVAQAYEALARTLDEPMRLRLRDAQRDWLRDREADELDKRLADRLAELRDARATSHGVVTLMLGGPMRPPFVVSALPGTAAYDAWAAQRWDDAQADDRAYARILAQRERCYAKSGRGSDDCMAEASLHRFRLEFVSAHLISVEEDIEEDEGAAHPIDQTVHHVAWLSRPGADAVGPKDLFADDRWKAAMARAVGKYLDEAVGADRRHDADDEASAVGEACDPANWGLVAEGLHVTAQGYDFHIGRGFVDFVVPWREFGKSLRPEFAEALRE